MNWNTLLLTLGFSFLGWQGNRSVIKIDAAHDDIIKIQSVMVGRQEFDAELTAIKLRMASIELDIITLKKLKLTQ